MEGRRDHRISVVVVAMLVSAIGVHVRAEEKPPPLDTPPTTVVYTTPDSAVVESERGPSASPSTNVVKRSKSSCDLEAVGTEGEVPGLGQVSIPSPEDKKAYWVMCDGQSMGLIWLPIRSGSAPKPSTPGDIAERLRSEIPMPQVSIRMNPSVGLVGSESWFWIEGYGGDAISNSTDAFGSLVELEAKPTRYEWSFGDGSTLVGDTTGRPYPERSEIRHVFERAAPDGHQVGKNESGKTAFLEALYRLNPLPTGHPVTLDLLRDFPRSQPRGADAESIAPIEATFELTDEEAADIEEDYGNGVLTSRLVTVSRNYANTMTYSFETNETPVVRRMLEGAGIDPALGGEAETIPELLTALEKMVDPPAAVDELLGKLRSQNYRQEILKNYLAPALPRFLYFDEYSELPGRVSIPRLQGIPEEDLGPGERTALGLLKLAGVASESFAETEYEARKAALEWAANQISDEVFRYWSQNKNLSVEFDVDPRPDPEKGEPPLLEIRIRNLRHRVSLNFDERSRGFVWFFSFVAAFSEFRDSKEEIILLLDEPGLGLHASAQNDLLRYVEERLAPERPVVYTTHSPFMVDPRYLDRARTVEDVDDVGTKVRNDVLVTNSETLFPLQAALGYELAQTLFVGPDNLLVEGPADLLYLQVMSDHLRSLKRTSLDPRWVIVPAGGLDKIPTFVALFGSQLNITIVMDVSAGGSQRVNSMVGQKVLSQKALVPLNEITGTSEADIEDLFEPAFYLKLLKASGAATAKVSDLSGADTIVRQVERATGGTFSHYRPARYLLEHQEKLLGGLGDETLERFEALFDRINLNLS